MILYSTKKKECYQNYQFISACFTECLFTVPCYASPKKLTLAIMLLHTIMYFAENT